MSYIVTELYEALIAAGAPEEKAKAAAGAIAVTEEVATKRDLKKGNRRTQARASDPQVRLRAIDRRFAHQDCFLRLTLTSGSAERYAAAQTRRFDFHRRKVADT